MVLNGVSLQPSDTAQLQEHYNIYGYPATVAAWSLSPPGLVKDCTPCHWPSYIARYYTGSALAPHVSGALADYLTGDWVSALGGNWHHTWCQDAIGGCAIHRNNGGCSTGNPDHLTWRSQCRKTCGYCLGNSHNPYHHQFWLWLFHAAASTQEAVHATAMKHYVEVGHAQGKTCTCQELQNIVIDSQTRQCDYLVHAWNNGEGCFGTSSQTAHDTNYGLMTTMQLCCETCFETLAPTKAPTYAPSYAPTRAPTKAPTRAPTKAPTKAPTRAPTKAPTKAPTRAPTRAPSFAPSSAPSFAPTKAPSFAPTHAPTRAPTTAPSFAPTTAPSFAPTPAPTTAPSFAPTHAPTTAPSFAPSSAPSFAPTFQPCPNNASIDVTDRQHTHTHARTHARTNIHMHRRLRH